MEAREIKERTLQKVLGHCIVDFLQRNGRRRKRLLEPVNPSNKREGNVKKRSSPMQSTSTLPFLVFRSIAKEHGNVEGMWGVHSKKRNLLGWGGK